MVTISSSNSSSNYCSNYCSNSCPNSSPINQPSDLLLTCSICLESLNSDPNQLLFTTPCSHTFHSNCIHSWVNSNNSCPICRQPDIIDIEPNLEYNFEHNFYHIPDYTDDDDEHISPPLTIRRSDYRNRNRNRNDDDYINSPLRIRRSDYRNRNTNIRLAQLNTNNTNNHSQNYTLIRTLHNTINDLQNLSQTISLYDYNFSNRTNNFNYIINLINDEISLIRNDIHNIEN